MVLFLTLSLTVTRCDTMGLKDHRPSLLVLADSHLKRWQRLCPYSERSVGIDIDVANSLEARPNHGGDGPPSGTYERAWRVASGPVRAQRITFRDSDGQRVPPPWVEGSSRAGQLRPIMLETTDRPALGRPVLGKGTEASAQLRSYAGVAARHQRHSRQPPSRRSSARLGKSRRRRPRPVAAAHAALRQRSHPTARRP